MSVLVLIHEFGHFYSAKKLGVLVEEFGFGLPPKIIGKKFGETEYTLNWLPFGGFVKLFGEDELMDIEKAKNNPRNYLSKKPWQRLIILLAGVFMNLVLAIFLYFVFFIFNSFQSYTLPLFFDYQFKYGEKNYINTVVTGLEENGPADAAGVIPGEAIVEINGAQVYTVDEVRDALSQIPDGKNAKVLLVDMTKINKDFRTLEIEPMYSDEGTKVIGVLLSKAVTLDYSKTPYKSAFMHTYNVFGYSISTLGQLIGMSVEEKDIAPVSQSVSGPVGIFSIVGSILEYPGREAVMKIIDLTALLSVSLAFINLLPFPALDGGRALFLLPEMLTGKMLSPKIEGYIHRVGMLVLLGLIILVTFKDVLTFF